MKSILLASTAVIALAGAAAAEVSFGGSATLGYNNDSSTGNTDGFYWDAGLSVTLAQTLDNGLTASASFDVSIFSSTLSSNDFSASGLVLSLTAENAGLYFGDTEMAAIMHWAPAGDMDTADFSENDGAVVIRGDMTFGGWDASVSYFYDEDDGDLDQLSIGATGTVGSLTIGFAYQAEENDHSGNGGGDFDDDEVFGLSVGTSFSGADVSFAYAVNNNDADNSMGIEVAYPAGPVTVTGWYVAESDQDNGFGVSADYANGPMAVTVAWESVDGDEAWSIDGSYDVGSGLVVMAGVVDNGSDFYVGGSYDLGSGASLLVSYAGDTDDSEGDEVGAPEYQRGTTVELSFAF